MRSCLSWSRLNARPLPMASGWWTNVSIKAGSCSTRRHKRNGQPAVPPKTVGTEGGCNRSTQDWPYRLQGGAAPANHLMEPVMELPNKDLGTLFQQLGLPSDTA